MSNPDVYDDYRARAHRENKPDVFDGLYEARGCPGGPGHPGPISISLAPAAAEDVVKAIKADQFGLLMPSMLVMCQCNLVTMIQVLAKRLAEAPDGQR